MIIIAAIASLIIISVGLFINEKNASYLLKGYSNLSKEEQDQFDLKGFLRLNKRFHLFLGITLFVIVTALQFINVNAAGFALVVYPLASYIFFMVKSKRYFGDKNKLSVKISIWVLAVLSIGISLMLYSEFKYRPLMVSKNEIEIKGSYGTKLTSSEIMSISLVDELPKIKYKKNGVALGTVSRGYFKTKSGKTVKLFINSEQRPVIFILKKDSQEIYYSDKLLDNKVLIEQIKDSLFISR